MRTRMLAWLLAALVFVAGCGTADGGAANPPPTPDGGGEPTVAPEPTVTPETPEVPLAMDWTRPFSLSLPNGWVVRDCEGERTHVCVHDGEAFLGDIELLPGYPLTAEQAAQDPQTVLRDWAQDFVQTFAEDRAAGCPEFAFVGDDVADAMVGGQFGTRAGFTLTDSAGRVVERVVNHYTLLGGEVAIVNTDAYVEEGGCLLPSEFDPSFTPEALVDLEPYLDRLVADTPLEGVPD